MQHLQLTTKIIAHRGAPHDAPENTFASFNSALLSGCEAVEFDVMLSADGEPFVIHDETLERTTTGVGRVGDATSRYLDTLDAGKWFSKRFVGEKIPHLSEVIEWLNFTNVHANIEIKPCPGTAQQTTTAVLSCIHRYWTPNKPPPLISSFDWSVLQYCHAIAPEMPLGMLLHDWREDWMESAQEIACYSVHLHRKIAKKERVQAIKNQGYRVFVYVVNRKRQAKKFLELGVDGLFSDYPDLLS